MSNYAETFLYSMAEVLETVFQAWDLKPSSELFAPFHEYLISIANWNWVLVLCNVVYGLSGFGEQGFVCKHG